MTVAVEKAHQDQDQDHQQEQEQNQDQDREGFRIEQDFQNLTINEPSTLRHQAVSVATPAVVSSSSRLILLKLTLINFKSYAGTVEIGPFHKSFSSVVGPNGSGKSNVIDSLLFVFGFKAKKLRQGKLKDLIHCSASYPDLDNCQVQVHFALMNDEADSLVPDSSFVVSRSVKKTAGGSESSSYAVDGKVSSYSKVQDLLKGYGVDLEHKRFLILQGEVESISLMKPKGQSEGEDGLLEYLEDIIGTTRYAEPIKEATAALDSLTDVYETHLVKFKHAQKDTLGLKDKSQEAIAYIEWENDLARMSNRVLQLKIHKNDQETEKVAHEIEEWSEQVAQLEESQSGHNIEVSALEQEMNTVQESVKELSAKASASAKNLSDFESLLVSHKETEKFLLQKKKKLSKGVAEDKRQKAEDHSWISNFESDTATAKKDAQNLKDRLDKEVKVLADIQEGLRDKTQGLQTQIESLQIKLDPYLEQINAISSQVGVASHEREIVDQAVNGGRIALEEAQLANQRVLARMADCRKELNDVEAQVQQNNALVVEYSQKIKSLEGQVKVNEAQVQTARAALSEAKLTMESNDNRSKVYKTIMAHASSGKLGTNGVLGRLGNLGSIDEKYDVAITTLASGSLDSIVVEKVEDAQLCIAFLKKHQLGRANFLCLDKMQQGRTTPFQYPPRSQRLFDLVKMKDERFRNVFYHALGDSLVTDNLDVANQVAYSHGGGGALYRVVTLTGQVIEKSGAMSGGGARISKGGMSKSGKGTDMFTPKQLEELEAQHAELVEAGETLKNEADSASANLESAKAQVSEWETRLSKLKLEKESLKTEVKDTQDAMDSAKQSSTPNPTDVARLAELDTQLLKLEKQLQNPQTAASELHEKIKSLQDEIMQIGGVRLRSQHAKVESLQEQIQAVQKKLAKLVAEKGMREKNLVKLTKNLEKKEAELDDLDVEMERIAGLVQDSMVESNSMREQAREELETAQEKLQEFKNALAERTNEMNRARSVVMEVKAKISGHKATLSLNNNRAKQWDNELKQLALSMTGFEELDSEIAPLETYEAEQLDEMNLKKAAAELEKIKTHFTGNLPNLAVLQEYRKKMEIYQERSTAVEKAGAERDEKKSEYDRLRKERLDTFMAGFTAISQKLKEMYQMITMGGNAELELVDSLDPFSEGVLFSVMPPKKSWKNIANLSGGEKTLSSLALVFALHHFKPTPLYVMDEIDAALDFRNVSIIANYIKQRTRNAQFVIISLRNNMFELADRLVGIYKTDNTSKSITINPSEVEEMSRAVARTLQTDMPTAVAAEVA